MMIYVCRNKERTIHVYRGDGPDTFRRRHASPSDMEVKAHEVLVNLSANEGSSITKVK